MVQRLLALMRELDLLLRYMDIYLLHIFEVSPDTMDDVFLELWNSNIAKSDTESSVNATHA